MLEAVLDPEDGPTSDHRSTRRQCIEVITRGERRRRWTAEQKREIAAESLEPGTSPITVARKHGISTGQLYTWRQQLLRGALALRPRRSRVSCASMWCRSAAPAATVPARRSRTRNADRAGPGTATRQREGGSRSCCRAACRSGWMRRWMGLRCGGCWPRWNGHDRGTTWRAGLSRLRHHRHEAGHGGTCHAGAADPVGRTLSMAAFCFRGKRGG